jgi:raffinose/stachyose/melibiose transport system substrate-binding protein
LSRPPITKVGSTPASASTLVTSEVVVVLPCVPAIAMPWDTQLDPATNTRLQQELTLLVQGDITPDEFIKTMDAALTENVDD